MRFFTRNCSFQLKDGGLVGRGFVGAGHGFSQATSCSLLHAFVPAPEHTLIILKDEATSRVSSLLASLGHTIHCRM